MSSSPVSSRKSASKPRRVKGCKLEPVTFTRGLKHAFDSPAYQRTVLRKMRKVTSTANKKMDHVCRSLLQVLLKRGKGLLRQSKKEGLDIGTVHSLQLFMGHDPLGLVQEAHDFAMERVEQYEASLPARAAKAKAKAKPAARAPEAEPEASDSE